MFELFLEIVEIPQSQCKIYNYSFSSHAKGLVFCVITLLILLLAKTSTTRECWKRFVPTAECRYKIHRRSTLSSHIIKHLPKHGLAQVARFIHSETLRTTATATATHAYYLAQPIVVISVSMDSSASTAPPQAMGAHDFVGDAAYLSQLVRLNLNIDC